ncbi:MAG: TfoX/Sxy family protein [Pseudomonadota bacterium]
MTTRLEELPNLGKTTLQWLRAIGIKDRETLESKGIFWAYTSMRARRFRVTTAVLYSLAGALEGRPWRTLTTGEKERLLQRLASFERRQESGGGPRPPARAGRSSAPETATTPRPRRSTDQT